LWAQTCVLLLFTVLGQVFFRFDVTLLQIALGLVAAWLTEIVLARAARGEWLLPLSATISGLSVGLLLRSTELWPFGVASFLAISSKYALRVGSRHIFNPSNLGITLLLVLPFAGTRLDPGQWPNLGLLLFLVAALGIVVLFMASRLALVLPFAAGWALVLAIGALATGFPLAAAPRPLLTGSAILFAFFMLTDPRTTPPRLAGQALFGAATGILGGVLMLAGVPYAIFLSLVVVCLAFSSPSLWKSATSFLAHRRGAPIAADRRAFVTGIGAAALSAGFLAAWPLAGRAGRGGLADRWTASGGGVNLKHMPDESGNATVPLRENFFFDMNQALCSVEYNAQRFVMPTYAAGKQTIEPGQFYMLMVAPQMARHAVTAAPNGARKLVLEGDLDCTTYAGTSSSSFGSRDKPEPATFHIEAVDGGGKPGPDGRKPGDSFAFSVYFLKDTAPVNFAIFGPSATFTGDIVAGRVTIRSLDELTA